MSSSFENKYSSYPDTPIAFSWTILLSQFKYYPKTEKRQISEMYKLKLMPLKRQVVSVMLVENVRKRAWYS